MREWHLRVGDPLALTISADARLTSTNYCDDQTWELTLGGGEPSSVALQTTYGLRARSYRLFPRFQESDVTMSDPVSFTSPPVVRYFCPNYLQVVFSPFKDIEIVAEYWVPDSQVVAGRFNCTNQGKNSRSIKVEMVATLSPVGEGQRMAIVEIATTLVLVGRSGNLEPVLFLTGGPQGGTGPYTSLVLPVELASGETRRIIWTSAGLETATESFELARRTATRNWDAESARLQLLNSGQVEVYSGAPEWDAAFSLTQKEAFRLFMSPTDHLRYASIVATRQPDQGYSLRGDGIDYSHLWNGQSPLDVYYLSELILPTAPNLPEGLLLNYLEPPSETGFVDWKPGLGGQRGQLLATPVLVSLADMIFQANEDLDFLERVFPSLLKYHDAWFSHDHDRDEDGIPEWDHPMQAGLDDHPLFANWHPWSQGIDISTVESPVLCAFLYRECQLLIKMAEVLRKEDVLPDLRARMENLRNAVEISWDTSTAMYRYWDRDSHFSTACEVLGERIGSGEIAVDRSFEHPVRLLLQISTRGETTRRPQVFVNGCNPAGQHLVERIPSDQFSWFMGRATTTSDRIYSSLERIVFQGLDLEDAVTARIAGCEDLDCTLLLPIWAGIPSPERAEKIIRKALISPRRFWGAYGIPMCPKSSEFWSEVTCRNMYLFWTSLIGEGLVSYGYRKEAAELMRHIMAAVVNSLKQEASFRRQYRADTGNGQGERNSLQGLVPLGLFLRILGVRLISPRKVGLNGFNPFPWPVTVKYRGLTVLCQHDKTTVVFPDGQTVLVDDPEPCIVSLEKPDGS